MLNWSFACNPICNCGECVTVWQIKQIGLVKNCCFKRVERQNGYSSFLSINSLDKQFETNVTSWFMFLLQTIGSTFFTNAAGFPCKYKQFLWEGFSFDKKQISVGFIEFFLIVNVSYMVDRVCITISSNDNIVNSIS